ncbi:MAG: metal-dependent transcriptional regulator [Candidatus Nomurabacteria bacterium]|nr:metal-dependent transcriptional regulator [Candidatus Nomurabacteria bacterium]USN88239.1 MAG: metal-dependent transcriptional regulator [Candidatus Nomurabacteria bacterium]
MTPKPINAAREDYVRAIYILQESKTEIGVTQIAERLGLSKSTVSERLKSLVKDSLVDAKPYGAVKLTPKGLDIGRKLTYKHRIIEVFLVQILGVPSDRIHEEAEKLEHACSDDVIQRIAKLLNHPTNDPHGSEIPQIKNWES